VPIGTQADQIVQNNPIFSQIQLQSDNISPKIYQPVGFANYGNNCWLNSGLQTLFANKYFVESVYGSLSKRTNWKIVKEPVPNKTYLKNKAISYPELDTEFSERINIQSALKELIQASKTLNDAKISFALQNLHQVILNTDYYSKYSLMRPGFPVIGVEGDPSSIYSVCLDVLDNCSCYTGGGTTKELLENSKNPLTPNMSSRTNSKNEPEWVEIKLDKRPELVLLSLGGNPTELSLNPDTLFDLSSAIEASVLQDDQKAFYRICGFTNLNQSHFTSCVCYGNQWYFCDDSSIKKIDRPYLKNTVTIILERI
jgi:hypothetical protein